MKNKYKENKLIIISAFFCVIIFLTFIIIKGSYATEENISNINIDNNQVVLECDSIEVIPSGTISCQIKGKDFITPVSSFSADIVLDNNLSLLDVEVNSIWEGSGENGIIDLYTDENKTGDFEIATFTIKISDNNIGFDSVILLKDIVYSDNNFDEYTVDNITENIRVKSNINTLSDLTVSGITFDFDSNTTSYNLNLDSDEITITAIATSSDAIVSGDIGTQTLSFGENIFTITVTSEAGTKKDYVLNINRPESLKFDKNIIIDDEKKYLIFDEQNLNANSILSKIDTTGEVVIKNIENVTMNNTDVVGTGYNVNIKLSMNNYQYTIIVLGDVNSDGLVTVNDVAKIFQYYRGTFTDMEESYILAGDVKKDGSLKLTDVAKLFQYVRNNIDTLK